MRKDLDEFGAMNTFVRVGGYDVIIIKDGNQAYLQTKRQHELGDEIPTNFLH